MKDSPLFNPPSSLLRLKVLSVLLACMSLQVWAQQTLPTIYGNVIYSDTWGDTEKYGMYSFQPTANPEFTAVSPTDEYFYNGNGGGIVADGIWHLINKDDEYGTTYITYYAYDFNTFASAEGVGTYGKDLSDQSLMTMDMTQDPTTGTIYGCFLNASGTSYNFATVHYPDLTKTQISNWGATPIVAMAANAKGVLYGVRTDGNLYTINKENGEQTLVGALGVTPGEMAQSMTFDLATGRLYWAAQLSNWTSGLYEIDPATGAATQIAKFKNNETITTLYIPYTKTADGTPLPAENLALQFSGASLEGTVSFDMPTLSSDSVALTGSVNYNLIIGGEVSQTGSAQPGEHVSLPLTLPQGMNDVAVTASNDNGQSQRTALQQWIGYDDPVSTGNAEAAADDNGCVTIKWLVPKTGVHNGYIDGNGLTYDVLRSPGDTLVASAISDTTFTDNLRTTTGHLPMKSYQYTVKCTNGNRTAQIAASNKVVYGDPFSVPYKEDFSTQAGFDLYTVINNNEENYKWTYINNGTYEAAACFSGTEKGDDWLITPPIKLEKDRYYTFSYRYRAYSSSYTELMEAAWGQGNDPTTYANILPETEVTNKEFSTFSTVVQPLADGNYRFAIHYVSNPGMMYLMIDDISVAEDSTGTIFHAVTAEDFADVKTLKDETPVASVRIRNAGTQPVSSISYSVEGDGVETNETTVTLDNKLTFGNSAVLSLAMPAESTQGYRERRVVITKVNEVPNDIKDSTRIARGWLMTLSGAAKRNILMEEFTGTWCGWCPRGAVGLELFAADHPEDGIPVAVHNGDPMAIKAYDNVMNTLIDGYPRALLNRAQLCDPYYGSTTGAASGYGLEPYCQTEAAVLTEAAFDGMKAVIADDNSKITLEGNVRFNYTRENAPYALGFILVGDSIVRPDGLSESDAAKWYQHNYFSGDNNYKNDENLSFLVGEDYLIKDIVFRHVAIQADGVDRGKAGSLETTFSDGEEKAFNYSFDLTENTIFPLAKSCKVVALLFNTKTGVVVNAAQVDVRAAASIHTQNAANYGAEQVYSVQGTRLNKAGRGLNIIRKADGTVVKIMKK